MLTTVEALAATAIGLVPGAVYVATYDGQVGQGRSALPDRLIRYLTVSVVFHAVMAPVSVVMWHQVSSAATDPTVGTAWLLWLPALAYVAIPGLIGAWHGRATRRSGRTFIGRLAASTGVPSRLCAWLATFEVATGAASSWDHVFGTADQGGLVRARLRSGAWLGGYWGEHQRRTLRSHATAYPDQGELFLVQAARMHEDGTFQAGSDGAVLLGDEGLLIRWDDVDMLYFEYVDPDDGAEHRDEEDGA